MIYDADTRDAINITHLERTAGCMADFSSTRCLMRASSD